MNVGDGARRGEFTAFVRARGPDLLRAAEYLTADRGRAENLLQVALTKTYLSWAAARRGDPYAYTRRVLVNSNIDVWRRRRWRERPHNEPGLNRPDTDAFLQLAERDVLVRALAQLTGRQRSVVVLRYFHDLSERDAAAVLGVSIGTIKSTAHRALAKLRLDPQLTSPLGGAHDDD